MLSQQELINRFLGIRIWKRGDQRAPHKPLLQRKEPRMITYSEVMETLQRLLDDFGPPRRSSPAYPFYHIASDGIWEFSATGSYNIVGSPSDRFLLNNNVSGGFSEDVYAALIDNPILIRTIASNILNEHFPHSMYSEILQAVGLDLDVVEVNAGATSRFRDSEFRERILIAYSFKCAVCGFNVWLGRVPVALEARISSGTRQGGLTKRITDFCFALCTINSLTEEHLVLITIYRSRFLTWPTVERDLNSGLPVFMARGSAIQIDPSTDQGMTISPGISEKFSVVRGSIR